MEVTNEMKQQLLNEILEVYETQDIPEHAITVTEMMQKLKEQGVSKSRSTVRRLLCDKVENEGWKRAWDGSQYCYWREDG